MYHVAVGMCGNIVYDVGPTCVCSPADERLMGGDHRIHRNCSRSGSLTDVFLFVRGYINGAVSPSAFCLC